MYVADRSPGWGLGSHAFVVGGVGTDQERLSDGDRYFAEGGGGLSSGPFGVELSVKFAWNHLTDRSSTASSRSRSPCAAR